MEWIKYSEKKPELNQWILAHRDGRPVTYWMGFYCDAYSHTQKEIFYWLPIPPIDEEGEMDENQPS